jgi:hypothetical protein
MAEPGQALHPLLNWRPFPPGDPGPEIYAILREVLDRRQILEVANVLIEADIRMTEARLDSARALQKVVSQGIGRSE